MPLPPHGGNIYRHPNVTDYSANINPLGTPPEIIHALHENDELWAYYPDPDCTALTRLFAAKEQVKPECLVWGNGADELIWRIAQTFRPRTACIFTPAFTEYRRALEAVGCEVTAIPLRQETDFTLTETELFAMEKPFDMVIVCNPNNPTGKLVSLEALRSLSRTSEWDNTVLVSDESFFDLTDPAGRTSLREYETNLTIVLRSFTKSYAIPGLRLGCAVCGSAEFAERLRSNAPSWTVSAPAQIAGEAALRLDGDYLRESRQCIRRERRTLSAGLARFRFRVILSDTNFILFQAFPGFRENMLEQGFLIRSCADFEGLDETWYRIAVRTDAENERFLEAVQRVMS